MATILHEKIADDEVDWQCVAGPEEWPADPYFHAAS